MSYKENLTETFYYFSDHEKEIIERFLVERGYGIITNVVCGRCCGMYANHYYLGMDDSWKTREDMSDFKKLMARHKISCSFSDFRKDGYHYTISADPREEDIKLVFD